MELYMPIIYYEENEVGDLDNLIDSYYDFFYERKFILETDYYFITHIIDVLRDVIIHFAHQANMFMPITIEQREIDIGRVKELV